MNKRILILISIICVLAAVSLFLIVKNGQLNSSAAGDKRENTGAPVQLNMMSYSFNGGGWPEDNIMVEQLDHKLNMNLKIGWTPLDNYSQKLNVLAASNELPDVYSIEDTEFNKWKDKGAFLDMAPLLHNYPNLSKYLTADSLAFMNPKGSIYGLPYYFTETRDSLIIRQDWLEKLGLEAPKTMDEFLAVAEAFATQDPDGNGKPDTSGFSFSIVNDKFYNADYLLGAFGLGNEWIEKEGRLIPMQIQTQELKQFLAFIKKAYKTGALDRRFVTNKLKDPLAKLETGETGITTVVPSEFFAFTVPVVHQRYPGAKLVQLVPPKGPTGLQATQTMKSTNKVVINARIDPAKQKKALELLDYLLSDEGYDLNKNGIKGVHYTRRPDGSYRKLPAFDTDRPQLLTTWFFRREDPDVQVRKWDDPGYVNNVSKFYAVNEKYRWANPAAGLTSETQTQKGAFLQSRWMDTILKVAVGELPISAVDEAAEMWKKDGGERIIEEINREYRKAEH